MRVGLYARISNAELQEGYSIEAQLDALRAHATAQQWQILGEYVDPGYSGKDGNRPDFQRLMDDAKAGQLEVVAVHKLDRFYRNLRGQLDALNRLDAWGVAFASVVEAIDYSTPWGKLVQNQLGAFNQFYLDNLSQETIKGKKARAKSGRTNASVCPYGYKRREKPREVAGKTEIVLEDPVPDPETAHIVVSIFETYATGLSSDDKLALTLAQKGYKPSERAKSGRWTREGVRNILNNPFYVGKVRHGDDLYEGLHEPLVDEELWERVRVLRRKKNMGRGGRRRPDRVYLLQTIATCRHCGLPLGCRTANGNGRRGIPTQYYTCPAKRRSVDCPAGGKQMPASTVDQQVGDLVKRLRLPDDWRDRLVELVNHQAEHKAIEGKRKYLAGRLKRLGDRYELEGFSLGEYKSRYAQLQSQLNALKLPERPDLEKAGEQMENLTAAWERADLATRHEILGTVFEEIRVDGLARRVICVRPHGDFLPLFRLDSLEEKEDGCFYYCGEGAQPAG